MLFGARIWWTVKTHRTNQSTRLMLTLSQAFSGLLWGRMQRSGRTLGIWNRVLMYAGPGRYGYGWEDDLHGRPTPMKTEGGPPGAHIMPRIRGQQRRNGETRRSRFNQRLGMRAENQRSRLDANKELRSSEVDSVWIVVATMGGDHRPISHGTTCLRTAYWRRMLRSKKRWSQDDMAPCALAT
jgi:hypothetical protein